MILIVDDRPENILPLKKILELHNFKTDSAGSGEEALKKVLTNSYSLIILDVQMPGMDGFEVAEALSGYSKAKDIPIIFLSAVNKEKKFITKGYVSGGIDYLTKPVDTEILMLKVKNFNKLYEQQLELKKIQESLRIEVATRKQAEEELAVRVDELRLVLESLPQIAFSIGADGTVEYANEHWFNYSQDLQHFPETHPEDSTCEAWKSHLEKGLEFTREVRLRDLKTHDYRYFLLKILPIQQNDEIVSWVGTFTDIHQQKQANEILEKSVQTRTKELVEKNKELETSNHELQQFAWVVSHDLKEPLRKIQTFNDIIKSKYLSDNDEAVSYLDRSIKSSARMSRLINDLLDYSRLSVSSLFRPTDLNSIIEELLTDFDELILNIGASIQMKALPVVEVIPGQIRQVFQNLISNALKFTRPGIAPVLSIESDLVENMDIDAPSAESGSYCRIVLTDNGIGFDEKFLERIFIIFQRLNNKDSYEGTGIGLAIAKKIIEKHGGIISARSAENQGARFIIILPLVQQATPTTNEQKSSLFSV